MRDFALETYFSKWEFSARHHMTASDMESLSLADLLAMADDADRDAFDGLWLGYTPTWGSDNVREAVAATYDTMAPDNILCFAGAEEGVYVAMRCLLCPEDHAIVVVPNYQAAETLPLDICAVSGVPLEADDDWSLDIDRVAAEIRPNTKLVSINFPNNPTGAVLERGRFDAVVELCRRHGLWLFSDEVYRLIERDAAIRLPQVADVYERGLSLNVMSKAYGLPGLRIGWIAGADRDLLGAMERYKHYLSICNSAPSEQLAVIALKARDRILERNRALAAENAEKLGRFFAGFPDLFEWKRPDGGCVGFPRYLGEDGADAFCEDLVERAGVLLLPPKVYRSDLLETPQDRFRIGFGRQGIDEGLEAFRGYLMRNG